MKKYEDRTCEILSFGQLTEDVFDFTVEGGPLAEQAQPGQFAQIRLPGRTLRRPISICQVDKEKKTLRFVFQVRGGGTEELSRFRPGDQLEILAPLGHGFPIFPEKKVLLLGGGIGVPPLLEAAAQMGHLATVILGFRTKSAVILEQDFYHFTPHTCITTDDGSYGLSGLVTGPAEQAEFDYICACGPLPMLKAAAALAKRKGVPCYLSLEERMACGIGACLGCATPLLNDRGEQYYGHVCKDGPVFPYEVLVLE